MATAPELLKSYVERIERLGQEQAALKDDVKEVFAEAKGQGFDPKIMRKVIRIRKEDDAKRQEEQALLDTYMHSLGMIADLPLGQAAQERAVANVDALALTAARERGRQAAVDGKPRDKHPYRHTHQAPLKEAFWQAYDAAKNGAPMGATA